MKWPWVKRADEEKKQRMLAEEKCAQVEKDWTDIRNHRKSIDKEIEMNDWTATAIAMFAGKDG